MFTGLWRDSQYSYIPSGIFVKFGGKRKVVIRLVKNVLSPSVVTKVLISNRIDGMFRNERLPDPLN
jgi:hypothetical protein